MSKVYIAQVEDDDAGEVEGAFDADGNLLHLWSSNDATWSGEYFNPFLEALGIEVLEADATMKAKLVKAAVEMWA